MRPEQKIETFPDGMVTIYAEEANRTVGEQKCKLRYGNEVLGIKRYYEAKNSVKSYTISKVIKVPHTTLFDELDLAVIGDRQYRIRKIQWLHERGVDLLELESVKVKIREPAQPAEAANGTDIQSQTGQPGGDDHQSP